MLWTPEVFLTFLTFKVELLTLALEDHTWAEPLRFLAFSLGDHIMGASPDLWSETPRFLTLLTKLD
jgi:hypothetical protein